MNEHGTHYVCYDVEAVRWDGAVDSWQDVCDTVMEPACVYEDQPGTLWGEVGPLDLTAGDWITADGDYLRGGPDHRTCD